MSVTTLVELLGQRARVSPERPAYVFLHDGEAEDARLTNGELDQGARAVAAALQRLNTRGERALLFYPTGADFVVAFFACLYSGVVAVPVPAPGPGRLTRTLPRLQAIARDAQARLVLTTSRVCHMAPAFDSAAPELAALRWLATDSFPAVGDDEWVDTPSDANSIAFLQYTSGSTASPKGVVITHANILHNCAWIQRRFETSKDSVIVSWLPLYHDMGLVGSLISTLYVGGRAVLMSPEAFLQRPVRWLKAITHYRADISGGPNFAFEHCVDRVTADQRATLDLSKWTLAFSGAEPVRADTLERFARTFASCGFRRRAFYPCYGLAEATLFAAGGTRHTPPQLTTLQSDALARGRAVDATEGDDPGNVRHAVSCGRSLDDQRLIVVHPESLQECRPREVGEIWISGPSVATGYWNRSDETERLLRARRSELHDQSFLRTGDLGFLDEGELFVTGRLKDLIIVNGRNHYPQDIEQTVEGADPALHPGGCAAFSVEVGGEERLVIVAEVQRHGLRRFDGTRVDDTVRIIRRVVVDVHGVEPHSIQLLRPGGVLKTSSGKLRRHACRDAFLAGMLDVVGGEENVQPA